VAWFFGKNTRVPPWLALCSKQLIKKFSACDHAVQSHELDAHGCGDHGLRCDRDRGRAHLAHGCVRVFLS